VRATHSIELVSEPAARRPADQRRPPAWAGLPGVRVGAILGAPIFIAPSWLFFLAFVTYGFAPTVASNVPGIGAGRYAVACAFGVLLGVSVLAHEIGHVAVARWAGVPVHRVVLTWLAGHSALDHDPATAPRMAGVAAAGPAVNLLLAGVGWVIADRSSGGTVLWVLAAGLTWINAVVGAYNLLPGLPLDGGQVLRAVVWAATRDLRTATIAGAWAGRVLGAITGAVGLYLISRPSAAAESAGVWTVLIAVMMVASSSGVLRQQALRDKLPRLTARGLARPALAVTGDLPLAEAVRRAHEISARGLVVVDSRGHPTAVTTEAAVTATPMQRRPWVTTSSVSRPVGADDLVPVDLDGEALVARLQQRPASEYVVVGDDGALVGVIAAADVARALR
jgi:Zn-dependent protease/CBS domain-containing protein